MVAVIMVIVFLLGYVLIALEHPLKINKAGTALVMGTVLWVLYIFSASTFIPNVSLDAFNSYLGLHPELMGMTSDELFLRYVVDEQLPYSVGEVCETLIFLAGTMLVVEMIDAHGGFLFITDHITLRDKRKLLVLIATLTFFMSSVLANMTTCIVMIMLVRKLVGNYKERWLFGSIIVIASNSGGAWSPIGDVTTIMLWVQGNISTDQTITKLILPSIVSAVVPVWIACRFLHGDITPPHNTTKFESESELWRNLSTIQRVSILVLGVLVGLMSVPVFKSVTNLPPYMGMLLSLGILWIYTDQMYAHSSSINEGVKSQMTQIIRRLDTTTLFFFLGILLAVDTLSYCGVLGAFASWLDSSVGNVYVMDLIIGILSSIVDNVPLVSASMNMYPIATDVVVEAASDPEYMLNFVEDGAFWQFLTYTAGVGGSMMIIGSASGIVMMGLERVKFIWYTKNISLMAFAGYMAGAVVYGLEKLIFSF